MKSTYDYFMNYATDPAYNPKGNPVTIFDGATITSIKHTGTLTQTFYEITYHGITKDIKRVLADKIFIAAGV